MHISIPIVFRFLNFCFAGKMRYHPFLFAAESLITLTAIITFPPWVFDSFVATNMCKMQIYYRQNSVIARAAGIYEV